ncbi:DUF2017 family protein [Microbacterium sp. cf332]|uniref:DUF2017 family protein n=1 Tax=Microbacterium sp. cf332 TaxID=1761804 RepID=UPI00210B6A58|nr:DUF2017 family protein [Microbacterium sp. cf332]
MPFALPVGEVDYLRELVEQYLAFVTAPTDPHDPAARRLSPDAYPDAPEASAEFRDLTAADVSTTRARDAELVLAMLSADDAEDAAARATVRTMNLDEAHQLAWLRTLAGLRLVLAERIGITDESIMPVGDPRFDVYEWLGYRQEMLLQALDA